MLGGQENCDMLTACCRSLTFCEVSLNEADIPFVRTPGFCLVVRVRAERGCAEVRASRDYSGGRAGQGRAVSALLGANVRLRPSNPVAAGKLPKRFARSESGDGFQVCPLPRDFSRRSGCLRRRRRGKTNLQLFVRRSDLRRLAESRCAAFRRAELHAQEARRGKRRSSFLVQANCFAAQGLQQVG